MTPLAAADTHPPAVELKAIDKHFGPVHANRAVSLAIEKGTIHGIVGENGAGKSTLMSILYGYYEPDSGDIVIDGKTRSIATPQDAIAAGIGMVHQHFMLVDTFTVLENVILGAEGSALLAPSKARARGLLAALAREHGLDIAPDALVETLPVGLQQRVEILKALYRGAEILILDEPTGVLTPSEAAHLFKILKHLRDHGRTIILITHKLKEIMAITDRVSVMRRGELVATLDTGATDEAGLAELMVGRPVLLSLDKAAPRPGPTVLELCGVTLRDGNAIARLDNVSFAVRAGEIVGIAGVSGNGQSELLEAIVGMRRINAGTISIAGRTFTASRPANPSLARAWGAALVPEDRQREGLVMTFEENESAILGYQSDEAYRDGPLLDRAAIRARARDRIAAYDIRPPDCRLKTANFSGGNQQKIVLAREIEAGPALLLVGQPTRGVDIGAIEFIHRRILAMRDAGEAVLLVSVELDEILALADRVLVMFAGRIVGERAGSESARADIGLMMAGGADRVA